MDYYNNWCDMALLDDDLTLEELYQLRKDLKMALFSGAKRVEHKDRETEFHSVAQMRQALDQLEAEIAAKEGSCPSTIITPTVVY